MNTYILQKDYDTPGCFIPKGTESVTKDGVLYSMCNREQRFEIREQILLIYPDWFKLKEENLIESKDENYPKFGAVRFVKVHDQNDMKLITKLNEAATLLLLHGYEVKMNELELKIGEIQYKKI